MSSLVAGSAIPLWDSNVLATNNRIHGKLCRLVLEMIE